MTPSQTLTLAIPYHPRQPTINDTGKELTVSTVFPFAIIRELPTTSGLAQDGKEVSNHKVAQDSGVVDTSLGAES